MNMFNPLPHNPDFRQPWERKLLKTLWEKEKMLVPAFSLRFQQYFLPFPKQNSIFDSCLSYGNAFILNQSKNLSFDYPFRKRQISDSFKLKEFADDNFNLMKMAESSPNK